MSDLCINEQHLQKLAELKASLAAVHNLSRELMQDFIQREDDSAEIVKFRKIQAICDISGRVHSI
jgi:hypothetical protein